MSKEENENFETNKLAGKYTYRDTKLNAVSPTFCLAKWLQTTVTLYNGFTHSCHHPVQHKIEPEAVKKDPKALHNTPIKFYARKEMLEGIQTKECNYCWNIENLPDNHLSDRTYKSDVSWSKPYFDKVVASGLGENINPTYMEVAFENTCNFKCTYCSPDVSSRLMEEIQANGTYELSTMRLHDLNYLKQVGRFPIHRDDPNDYIDAFWKWWPELYQSLEVFRITGGEPLLSKHTWKVLDYIIENPRPDLVLAINTNMGVPRKLIDKLIEYTNKLQGKVKRFEIYTSCEATGPQAEYIRYGMNYAEFIDNCTYFLKSTDDNIWLNFMITTNILSVSTFKPFIQWLLDLRKDVQPDPLKTKEHRVRMMFSYIRWPQFLNLRILPDNMKAHYAKEWTDFAASNSKSLDITRSDALFSEEIDQIQRLVEFMESADDDLEKNMKDFAMYHSQYDERRNVSFDETFPELVDFINECHSKL